MKQESRSQIEALAGIKLPADANVLYQGGSGRDKDGFREYVVGSRSNFEIPEGSEVKIPSDSVAATIASLVPPEKTGKISGPEANVSDWVNDQGEWRASTVATSLGWVLHLEDLKNKAAK
ncbi:MAG: hypothetical protein WA324_22495 [Bryobacteraceae bacterium]